nr:MAG: putative capsid protein 1 [Polycipiviridae sp.]
MCVLSIKFEMETTENFKDKLVARATEIDSGATQLNLGTAPMFSNISLDPAAMIHGPAKAPAWSFAELVSQRKLMGTFPISTSTKFGSPAIWKYRHTFANVLNDHMREMKDLFHLYSWKLHFCLQFRTNYQQVGQIIVVQHHIPQNLFKYLTGVEDLKDDYRLMTMLPHVKVPMGEDMDVEVEMVWNAPVSASSGYGKAYSYKSWNVDVGTPARTIEHSGYDMGSVGVYIGQPMEVAANVNPQLTLRVWSWLTDVKYGAYTPTDDIL